MKKYLLIYLGLIFSAIANAKIINSGDGNKFDVEPIRPADFVNVAEQIPQMQFDIRYATSHNFVGRPLAGYQAPRCLLTKEAVHALKQVEAKLLTFGLTLKAYDCYRPQRAVNDFAAWARDIDDVKMRDEFYPKIDKKYLFADGYIAYQSGHSRGNTLDLTIAPVNSKIPKFNPNSELVSCTAALEDRFPDNSLDFGGGYDCFSPLSHPGYKNISAQAKANRLLLKNLMENAGFKGLNTEWWHFTLKNEPYPETYFDFPIK